MAVGPEGIVYIKRAGIDPRGFDRPLSGMTRCLESRQAGVGAVLMGAIPAMVQVEGG